MCVREYLCVSFHPRQKHVISRAPVLLLDRYNIKSHKSERESRGNVGVVGGSERGKSAEMTVIIAYRQ